MDFLISFYQVLFLFVSMIGAIVLTLHRQEYTKRQDIYTQVSRSVMIRARTI
jgi:hypothetical protein